MPPTNDISPDELQAMHRLVDGRLPAEQAAALRETLSPAALDMLADWQRQHDRLRQLHAAQQQESIPAALRSAAQHLQARQRLSLIHI